jgi:hypothetical protein
MESELQSLVTPEMDRRNGRIYFLMTLLIYLAAPVVYIGVVQAALCHRLGANATTANLPAAAYLLGQLMPFICSWLVPHRLEKAATVWSSWAWATLITLVLVTLVTKQPAWVCVAAVSAQGLLQGITTSVMQVFSLQCLSRGTTFAGRARTLKWSFTLGPIAAVTSSMTAQYILNHGSAWTRFPLDFALIYFLGAPCIACSAWLSTRFQLPPLADEPRPPFLGFLAGSFRNYVFSRPLVLLFLAALLMNCTLAAISNFSLHTREAMGRTPEQAAGLVMVLRFACKAVGGYIIGAVAVRLGFRAGAIACISFLAAGAAWAGVVSGPGYLFAFGLLGMGELGWVYLPNYVIALSPVESGPRNFSILLLSNPAASFAPVLLGALTDHFGFAASVWFALGASVIALYLIRAIKLGGKAA